MDEEPISVEVTEMSPKERKAVARIYWSILQELGFGNVRPSDIYESLEDWSTYQKTIIDPSGKKYQWASRLEKPLNVHNLLSGLIVPKEFEDNYDILNLLNNPWYHPVTEVQSNESFLDLYQKALTLAEHLIVLFCEALKDPKKEKTFFETLDNRSYNMNLALHVKPHRFMVTEF